MTEKENNPSFSKIVFSFLVFYSVFQVKKGLRRSGLSVSQQH